MVNKQDIEVGVKNGEMRLIASEGRVHRRCASNLLCFRLENINNSGLDFLASTFQFVFFPPQ